MAELPVNHAPTSGPGTPYAGVGTAMAMALQAATTNAQLCAAGYHAWVPWLDTGGFWLTWCAREGCYHAEQYDKPGSEAPEATRG